MNNLKTSEKILIALAALLVIAFVGYYGYQFLTASPANKKVEASENNKEISTPANDSNNNLAADAEGVTDKYIKTKAESAWVKNPFWDRTSGAYLEWATLKRTASGAPTASKIIYSGYIDAGKLKMAIINGLEYRAGEQLEMEGYVLEQVTPSQVLIVNKNSGNEVAIPLQE